MTGGTRGEHEPRSVRAVMKPIAADLQLLPSRPLYAFNAYLMEDMLVDAGTRHGLDLSAHKSREVDAAVIDWADLILVMTPSHLVRLAQLGGAAKAALLDAFAYGEEGGDDVGGGIPDPFGGDDEAYEETYRTLEELVAKALRRLEPILAP